MHAWIVGLVIAVAAFLFTRKANAAAVDSIESNPFSTDNEVPMPETDSLRRGERNNNPCNIEYNVKNHWVGQTGNDGRYAVFDSVHNGIRAFAHLMHTYATQGFRTVHDIVTKYAPQSENPTADYIDNVADYMSVDPNDVIDVADVSTLQRLATAVIRQENGRVIYTAAEIHSGITA